MPLPLFYIQIESQENNKNVYEITHLLHAKIKIEAPRKKNELPQCKKCQQFGHTQHYCSRTPKCVKCGASHLTKDCRKNINEAAKCANCSGNHTANWKGCPVYIEKSAVVTKPKTTVVQRLQARPTIIAQAAISEIAPPIKRNEQSQQIQEQSPPVKKETSLEDIIKYLQTIDSRISRLENKLTQPQKTKSKKKK